MKRLASLLLVLASFVWLCGIPAAQSQEPLEAGVAEADITPPLDFPIAGYYHERLATGTRDPLKAKALVLRQGQLQVTIVACDLTGIATDLTAAVRARFPGEHVILSGTHSHTAPDYTRDLYLFLDKETSAESKYAAQLIDGITTAINDAKQNLAPVMVRAGTAMQETPISFNRRFVMKDGSVRTWMSLDNPEVVRPAGPIDSQVGILKLDDASGARTLGVLSNFALHLDTVGGTLWSADYPYYVEQTVREKFGDHVISLFGTGCCGDINHVNPASKDRNTTDVIGRSLGGTVAAQLPELEQVTSPTLQFRSATVSLPLRDVSDEELAKAVKLLPAAVAGEQVEFFDLVESHRSLVLDHLRNKPPRADTKKFISWGLTHQLAGVGPRLPVEVNAVTLGREVAIVFLPGEIFVELGQAIKQASPFKTTLVIELSNSVETVYVPTRAAYAVGSYEVTNSTLEPGGGEMLVEVGISLLRDIASQLK